MRRLDGMRRLDCGQQHHLVVQCDFHLATFIDDKLISTVGDYYRRGDGTRDTVGAGRYYETFVFPTDNDWSLKEKGEQSWEHPDVTNWTELEADQAQTAAEATKCHEEMVSKYEDTFFPPLYGPHKREWYPA